MWSAIYHFLTHNELLNSNLFIGAATLIVGYAAYFLYRKQKRDEKKDAATILLAEVKAATTLLPGLISRFKDNKLGTLNEGLLLLPSESWNKYKYLFVNDLKTEEWQALDSFYKHCLAYDAAVHENESYFSQNTRQIWVSIHRNYLDQLKAYFRDHDLAGLEIEQTERGNIAKIDPEFAAKVSAFTDTYIANSGQLAGYSPVKPINDAEAALNDINKEILLSSVGDHLGRMANSHYFLFWDIGKFRK